MGFWLGLRRRLARLRNPGGPRFGARPLSGGGVALVGDRIHHRLGPKLFGFAGLPDVAGLFRGGALAVRFEGYATAPRAKGSHHGEQHSPERHLDRRRPHPAPHEGHADQRARKLAAFVSGDRRVERGVDRLLVATGARDRPEPARLDRGAAVARAFARSAIRPDFVQPALPGARRGGRLYQHLLATAARLAAENPATRP